MKAIISGSMVVGLGLILLLVAVGLAPKFVLWFGIILIALCIGANIKAGADLLRLSDRWTLRPPSEKWSLACSKC